MVVSINEKEPGKRFPGSWGGASGHHGACFSGQRIHLKPSLKPTSRTVYPGPVELATQISPQVPGAGTNCPSDVNK